MKYLNLQTAGLVLISILSCSAVNAACLNDAYRTYYLNGTCQYYFIDGAGNRVIENRVGSTGLVGLPLHQDAAGRWFYKDSFGNTIYATTRCG